MPEGREGGKVLVFKLFMIYKNYYVISNFLRKYLPDTGMRLCGMGNPPEGCRRRGAL